MTQGIATALLEEHLDFMLGEAKVVRSRRVPTRIRNKRKRYYRKHRSQIKRRQRKYRRKPRTKRLSKRREKIKKRLHLRPGSRRRIKMSSSNRNGNLVESVNAANFYEIPELKKDIEKDIADIRANPESFSHSGDESISYVVDVIASEHLGIHGIDNAVTFFGPENIGLEKSDDGKWFFKDDPENKYDDLADMEFAWEAIEEFAQKVASDLEKKLGIPEISLDFIHDEGSYVLMMYLDKEQGESVKDKANITEAEKKPVQHEVTIKLTLKEAAQALGYNEWVKTNDYLDADSYDDVHHQGYSAKDAVSADWRDPNGMDGVTKIFPEAVAIAAEDAERDSYAAAIGEARRDALKDAFEKIQVSGEYQSGDGDMISGMSASVESVEINTPKDEVIIKIKNPEHLINDIVNGVGRFAPELDPFKKATNEEIKSGFIANAGDFFDVYGERKPDGELDSRFSPDIDDKLYKEQVEFHVGEMSLSDVAHAVIDAVDNGRVDDEKEAIQLAAKLSKMNKKEISAEVAKMHGESSEKYKERAKKASEECVDRMRYAKRGGKMVVEMKNLEKLNKELSSGSKEDLVRGFQKAQRLAETLGRNFSKLVAESKQFKPQKEEKVLSEDDFDLDPLSMLPGMKEDDEVEESFMELLQEGTSKKKVNEAVHSDFAVIAEDAKKMIALVESDDSDPEEANEILGKMVEFLDKAMEKVMVVQESATKADVQKAIDVLNSGKNIGPMRAGNIVSDLAHSLKLYQSRGEFDGSLESAIECLRGAEYEIEEKEASPDDDLDEADDKSAMAQGNKFKVIPPKGGQHVYAKDEKTAKDLQSKLGQGAMLVDLQKGQVSEGDAGPDVPCKIIDWASNVMFGGKTFKTFDDAEEFLSEKLGDKYEEDRQEYDIVPVGKSRDKNFLDPKDPRGGGKKHVGESHPEGKLCGTVVKKGSEFFAKVKDGREGQMHHIEDKELGAEMLDAEVYFHVNEMDDAVDLELIKMPEAEDVMGAGSQPSVGGAESYRRVGEAEEKEKEEVDEAKKKSGYNFKDKESQMEALANYIDENAKWMYEYDTQHEDAGSGYLDAMIDSINTKEVLSINMSGNEIVPILTAAKEAGVKEKDLDAMLKELAKAEAHGVFYPANAVGSTGDLGEIEVQLSGMSGKVNGKQVQDMFEALSEGLSDEEKEKVAKMTNEAYWDGKGDFAYASASGDTWMFVVDSDELEAAVNEKLKEMGKPALEIEESKTVVSGEIISEANKGRPPGKWFKEMEKDIKKKNPKYTKDQIKKTVGSIWHKKLSAKKREELIAKYESTDAAGNLTERHGKGFVENFPDLAVQLKDALEDVKGDTEQAYETFGKEVEEAEHESRDGFASSSDGGYEYTDFSALTSLTGSGSYTKMPKRARDAIEHMEEQGREMALENFKEKYAKEIEGIPEDKLNYHDLYDMKKSDLAERLSEMEMEANGEDTIMFQVRAFMEDGSDRDQGVDFVVQGAINWESPYHRSKSQWEEYKQVTVSFENHEDMKKNFKKVLDAVKECGQFLLGKGSSGKTNKEDANLDQEIGAGSVQTNQNEEADPDPKTVRKAGNYKGHKWFIVQTNSGQMGSPVDYQMVVPGVFKSDFFKSLEDWSVKREVSQAKSFIDKHKKG